MPNGTTTRPPRPHTGNAGTEPPNAAAARREGCGAWYLQFIPHPPALTQGVEIRENPDRTRERLQRWSVDNCIFFFPNPDNECTGYAFIQFARRTMTKRQADGTDGDVVAEWSHDWQPDVEGWGQRAVKKFLDLGEIIYNGRRVHRVKFKGLRRDDGPGYSHRFGEPLKNRRIKWEFKTYVVCDGGAKVVGLLEFSFAIVTDANGNPTLEFPAAGQPGAPQLTEICCQTNDPFMEWVDQWHYHTPLSDIPAEPGERRTEIRKMRSLVDQSAKSRKEFFWQPGDTRGEDRRHPWGPARTVRVALNDPSVVAVVSGPPPRGRRPSQRVPRRRR